MPLTDREREAARLGMHILDQALISLGRQPVHANPDFRVIEPIILDFPNVVLEKPGVAPFTFIFGPEIEVWVGPFSELLMAPVSEATENDARRLVVDLLQSSVTCRRGRRRMEIRFQRPGERGERLTVYGAQGAEWDLEPFYSPYVKKDDRSA